MRAFSERVCDMITRNLSRRLERLEAELAQVRHDTIVFVFFEPPNRSKLRGCNSGCKKRDVV